MSHFQPEQIGVVRSLCKEKFAVPRQSGLVKNTNGELYLLAPYNQANTIRGLEVFNHLWVVFVFHQTTEDGWRPTVRPLCLGGDARMGIFVMCSMFRPNPAGMSLVKLRGTRYHKEHVIPELGEPDLVDGTPVVDIKLCLPFTESLPDARASYAQDTPKASIDVTFSEDLAEQLPKSGQYHPHFRQFITEVLMQDPHPAYRKNREESKTYATQLLGFNVR